MCFVGKFVIVPVRMGKSRGLPLVGGNCHL